MARLGHEVHLLSQERAPLALPWVDAAGDWDGGGLALQARREPARVTVYRPDIGGLLPVYVADQYAGIEARPFPELSDAEVARYVEANVAAVAEVVERVRPDVALANHEIMGPAILARALAGSGVPYAVKVHGSALEYTVKPHPERFLEFAREGMAGARGVLAGSRHTAESLWTALGDPSLPGKTRLGPPGVDVARFAPREPAAAFAGVRALAARLAALAPDPDAAGSFARSPGEAWRALAAVEPGDRLVVFVGKLIASKGVELLLAAWPRVVAAVPEARLIVVGFGSFRPQLEHLAAALGEGDLDAARAMAAPLPELARWLDTAAGLLPARHALVARAGLTGRLDHSELEDLLPAAEALVMPSTFPESFGMVAAEAAASGALPLVADHSGMAEVADALEPHLPPEARPWLRFGLGEDEPAVDQIADRLIAWLQAPADLRQHTRAAIVTTTRERYSWEGVARTVIAAAEGNLEPPLP